MIKFSQQKKLQNHLKFFKRKKRGKKSEQVKVKKQQVTQCCLEHADRKDGMAVTERLWRLKLQRKVGKKKERPNSREDKYQRTW